MISEESNSITYAQITIKYIDGDSAGGNYFFNVQDFVQFMIDNPEIGKVLNYQPKEKK